MLQLTSIVAQVPPGLGLGYGLGGELGGGDTVAVLLAAPNIGIVLGGTCAGWIAARYGPALPLLGGIAVGALATFLMVAGVSILPLAVVCGVLVGAAAGAIGASGYNLAAGFVTPERQGTTAGLVSVVLALGSVVVNIAGGEVLKATRIDEAQASSAAGVYLYIALAGVLFLLAAVPAVMLVCHRRSAGTSRSSTHCRAGRGQRTRESRNPGR